MGYPDEFVKHGTCQEIEEKYGLEIEQIVRQILMKKEELNLQRRRGSTCLKILEKTSKKGQIQEGY